MPNLYHETAEPAVPLPTLVDDVRTRALVVGGGITGLSTALHLAQRGIEVVLLEAEMAGFGASGRNGGQVNPGLKPDPDVVERDYGPELGARMNAMAGGAPDFVFDLIKRHGIRCDARQNGTLRAAIHATHIQAIRSTTEQWARRGAPVDFLDADGAARATGTARYSAALLDRRGGNLNPLSYARGLARAAQATGALLYANSRAVSLSPTGGAWQVRTATGSVVADHVVLATNGYSDDLWPDLRRSVVPVFGAIAATEPLPDALARGILPGGAVLYESGAITVYYRMDVGSRLILGGRGPMREVQNAADIEHLLAYARLLWPSLQGVRWPHVWGGQLAMTRDHYPHVHELARGVVACLGYNGRGVALASVMGRELARRIGEPSAPFNMPITPLQTIGLHGLWPLAVRAAIMKGRIQDMLGR